MEFVIQSQHDPASKHEGPILTLSGTGTSEDERFMAVTRQEELLLAAMRAKRARMRESHQMYETVEPELGHGQDDDRKASKKESLSSIKTVKATTLHPPPVGLRVSGAASGRRKKEATTLLFPKPPSTTASSVRSSNGGTSPEKHEQVLLYLGGTISEMHDVVEPSPDLSYFLADAAKRFPAPASSSTVTASSSKPSHGRASSAAAVATYRGQPKTGRQPRIDSEAMKPKKRPSSEHALNRPDRDLPNTSHHNIAPVMERPESSSSYYDEDSQTEQQLEEQPQTRKKAARISAVGMLPEWGDDG